ncbi:fibronectin type III domain-containing protein, partial [Jatrophihabitans sp.]|uniref:fibronectin type III domain-containing protein n=1 Tax=Jatrophihabitans sp. TaxID=1932789 RepID=UPI0030C7667A|nr:hypothetical protein [Jatrophihabitans sp.]
ISRVFDGRAVVSGSSVTLPLLDHLQNVPYEITAANGATAAAVIHVPAAGAGGPYPVPNQLITMKENGTKTVDIADYVKDPLGKKLQLTTTSQLHAAPGTDLHLVGASGTSLKLTAANSYIGPAAITFQVTDGSSLHDPHGQLAVITVPVQIGPDTPVLRCPSDRISLVEGGAPATVDVTSVCHVWVPDPSELKGLRYSASWSKQPGSVTVGGAGTHRLTLSAGSAAVPGSTGVLSVGVSGTDAVKAQLDVVVLPLGPPSMSPIVIDGFTAGSTATRNITGSVSSELRDPVVSVVSIHQNSGMPSTVTKSGATVRITPSRASHGVMTYQVVVTDVADRTRKDRYATGSITLDVLNVPDAPGAPTAGRTTLSRVVQLSWPTPQNNGAPIDYYRVLWAGGSQRCAASPCSITGLVNGHKYAFTVEAHNAVGFSRPSPALSPPAEPDALPGAVAHLSVTQPADGAVTLVWTAAPDIGSAVQSYQLTWSGGGSASVAGTARRITARGLANDNVYTFTIVAKNRVGNGPPTSTQGESAGTPSTPGSVAVQYANAAGTTTRVVTVSWTASDPNGAGPSTYTVTRNGTAICSAVTATSCTDTPASGSTYTYSVTASNAAGHVSAAGSTSFAVAGTPDTVAGLNAAHTTVDGQLALAYTVPNSHGADSTIKCSYSTGGSCPSWTPAGAPGSQATQVFSGLPNDTAVSVTVTDCNSQQCGAPATSNAAVTDGPPSAPTNPSCGLSGDTVTFSWGRPAAINGYAVSFVLSGASSGSTNATSWSKSYPEDGANHTLTVTSHDSREAGGATSITCPDKSNPPPPPETVKVNMVAYSTGYSGCSAGCHLIQVTLTNFAANHTYTVNAQAPHPYSGGDGTLVMRTDGNGNYSGTPGPWYGYNDSVTVTVDGHSDTCSGSWGKPTGSCS